MRFALPLLLFFALQSFSQQIRVRPLADTVGFAHTKLQMDSVMKRIQRLQSNELNKKRKEAGVDHNTAFKAVIAPHDDYAYAGYTYPLALQNVKAKTVILFGVAHKAATLGLEDQLIFDDYTHWKGPYGKVKVSSMREEIMDLLPQIDHKEVYQVNDSMHKVEHSLEAEIPFLQYFNHNVEIIPILVPYMNYERMAQLSAPLAKAITVAMENRKLTWGNDVAIVISSDAVHYGSEDWGGKNFAFFGADSVGYDKAVEHEYEIMNTSLKDKVTEDKILRFTHYTVVENAYKEYVWTWCGRYSVPMGLYACYYMSVILDHPLKGVVLGYETSLSNKRIPVNDLGGMGVTAPASIKHWVGYAAIGFK